MEPQNRNFHISSVNVLKERSFVDSHVHNNRYKIHFLDHNLGRLERSVIIIHVLIIRYM